MSMKIVRRAEHYHMEDEMLSTYWHFSFGHYYDPSRVSFGPLRVFNDDAVQPGGGWGMHPHRDMEIVTYVVDGVIEHRDSTGSGGLVRAGEVQRMSAGTGILHSEFNPSKEKALRLLQIWIQPERRGLDPSYETKHFTKEQQRARLLPVVSGSAKGDAARIHQDATIYASTLGGGEEVKAVVKGGRRGYLFAIVGSIALEGEALGEMDVARIGGPEEALLAAPTGAELMLIDLP
jgi:hypothetical protein